MPFIPDKEKFIPGLPSTGFIPDPLFTPTKIEKITSEELGEVAPWRREAKTPFQKTLKFVGYADIPRNVLAGLVAIAQGIDPPKLKDLFTGNRFVSWRDVMTTAGVPIDDPRFLVKHPAWSAAAETVGALSDIYLDPLNVIPIKSIGKAITKSKATQIRKAGEKALIGKPLNVAERRVMAKVYKQVDTRLKNLPETPKAFKTPPKELISPPPPSPRVPSGLTEQFRWQMIDEAVEIQNKLKTLPKNVKEMQTVTIPLQKRLDKIRNALSPEDIEEITRRMIPKKEAIPPKLPAYRTIKEGESPFTKGAIKKTETIQAVIAPDKSPLVEKVRTSLKEAGPAQAVKKAAIGKIKKNQFARLKELETSGIKGESYSIAKRRIMADYKAEWEATRAIHYEPIRIKLEQENVDALFDMIKADPQIDTWSEFATNTGLTKVLDGKPPTANERFLLQKVFGKELTKDIYKKIPWIKKMKDAGVEIANIPRSFLSSFDLSFGMRQGIFLAPRYPKLWFRSFFKQFKEFGNEKVYQAAMDNIAKHPRFDFAIGSNLSLTELGTDLTKTEEMFFSRWAEKIPLIGRGIRASGRAYTGFANKFRFDVFDHLINMAEKQGITVDSDLGTHIANFINSATGRGGLGGLENSAVALNTFFFSPRLQSARLHLLNPAYYIRQPAFLRGEMLKSAIAFTSMQGTLLGLAELAGCEGVYDPRNSDFGKIKIGDTRIDMVGGLAQIPVLFSRLVTGKLISSTTGKVMKLGDEEAYKPLTRLDILYRTIEMKESPLLSLATALLRGQTVIGEKVSALKEIGLRFIPMVTQDIYDLIKEEPGLFPLGTLGFFGVGLQTYGYKRKEKTRKKPLRTR